MTLEEVIAKGAAKEGVYLSAIARDAAANAVRAFLGSDEVYRIIKEKADARDSR